ncbi:MAG TPA: hypothetical protein GX747_01085 [Tenericutes bacterium]|nr:hypothetical protein [Mycoplasmatota bacterium]
MKIVLLSGTIFTIIQSQKIVEGKVNNETNIAEINENISEKLDISTETDVVDNYLTEKQIRNKISKLQKKYKKIPNNDIKVLVVGANLDYITDDVLTSVLNIEKKSDLKKWGQRLENAIIKKTDAAYNTQRQYLDIYPEKPKYEHSKFVKLNELFFDENIIEHTKFIEKLINDCVYNFDDLEKSRPARITLLAHIFDFKSRNYGKYIDGFLFEFDDPKLGTAANYIINTYISECARKLNVEKTLGYLPHETPFDTLEILRNYNEKMFDNKNPLEKKLVKIKVLTKK